jgi:hypothetical protein
MKAPVTSKGYDGHSEPCQSLRAAAIATVTAQSTLRLGSATVQTLVFGTLRLVLWCWDLQVASWSLFWREVVLLAFVR